MDEYILGKARKSSLGDTNSEEKEEREDGEEEGEKRKVCSHLSFILCIVSLLCSFFLFWAIKSFPPALYMYVFGSIMSINGAC